MTKKKLTARQQEILDFILGYFQEHSFWPTVREIQQHFDFRSPNAALGHLRALERKQALSRCPSQARAFKLPSLKSPTLPDNAIDVVDIPVYGSIAAGYPDGIESAGVIGRLQIDSETAGVNRGNNAFALRVRGESMIDAGIFDGDVVILERVEPRNGDIVAALIDGETTLKRFIRGNREAPYLKAENPNYPELHPVSELIIQGVARAITRKIGYS